VISPRAPLGQRLIGRGEGDQVELRMGSSIQLFEVLRAC